MLQEETTKKMSILDAAAELSTLLKSNLTETFIIIGSTALLTHGVEGVEESDIDIIVEETEMSKLMAMFHVKPYLKYSDCRGFYSTYLKTDWQGYQVEICAGLTIVSKDREKFPNDTKVYPGKYAIEDVAHNGGTIHSVAKLAFMRSLLTALGREKDQQRLLLIENHLSEGS